MRRYLGVAVMTVALLLLRWQQHVFAWSFEDLAVYRQAGAAVLHGHSPYAAGATLPFTYPPFAAVVFLPFQAIGAVPAAVSISLLSAGSLVVVLRMSARAWPWPTLIVLGLACVALEPVLRTFRLGQINLVLVALVMLDVFLLPRRWRGGLTGVAAGLKLTPGIFVLYFALRRDWPALIRSAAGFALTIAVSSAVAPHPSWQFWTRLWYNPDHVGGVAYVDNQSLFGVLVRLTRSQHPARWLVLLLDLIALGLAVLAARRQLSGGDELAAVTCVGMAGLLVSPVSWSHHWIWLIPALFVLWRHRQWFGLVLLAGVGYLAPQWFTPAGGLREFHQNGWQELLCASFPLVGLIFLVLMLLARPGPLVAGGAESAV